MAKNTVEHSKLFEKYKERYDNGWCTVEQLRKIVGLGRLTPEEFEEITNQPYEE